jgi:hypothetical protein
MVLGGQPPGRVGRRRIFFRKAAASGLSSFYDRGMELREGDLAEKAGFRRTGTIPQDPPFRDGTAEAVRFELQ